jgi:chromosome segregation ATPase
MNGRSITTLVAAGLLALPLAITAGCANGMSLREAFSGTSKREQLAERVQEARNAQVELKGRFIAALDASEALMNQSDSTQTPDQLYDALKLEIRRAESAAKTARRRVADADAAATRYFESWREELAQYNRDELRSFSEQQLGVTEDSYQQLKATFDRADASVDPIIGALQDQVRFLDRNLSDRAISTLKINMVDLDREVAALTSRIDTAVVDSKPFVAMLGEDPRATMPADSTGMASASDPEEAD